MRSFYFLSADGTGSESEESELDGSMLLLRCSPTATNVSTSPGLRGHHPQNQRVPGALLKLEPVWDGLGRLLLLLFQLRLELCDLVSEAENIRVREEQQEVGVAPLEVWRTPLVESWLPEAWQDLLGPDLQPELVDSVMFDGWSSVSQPTYVPHALAFKQAYAAKVLVHLDPGPPGSRSTWVPVHLNPGPSGSWSTWVPVHLDPGPPGSRSIWVLIHRDPVVLV